MEIIFKPVDKDNWLDCVNLEVAKEQENFVQDNSFSLLQFHYDNKNYPIGIYKEDIMVGFLMYFYDEAFKAYRLRRFMIDKDFQGKGYGKLALLKLISVVKEQHKVERLYTSVKPDNFGAKKAYESVGFKATGEIRWNEEILLAEI